MQNAIASALVLAFFVLNVLQERGFRRRQIDPRGALPIARIPFVAGKLAMVLGWLGIVAQSYFVNLRSVAASPIVTWFAVAIEGLGVTLIWLGYLRLGECNQIGLSSAPIRLRVTGIYRVSRNPIYLGFHLVTIAAVLYTLSPMVLLLGLTSIGVHHAIVRAEEAHLARELGADYLEYRRTVRRYL